MEYLEATLLKAERLTRCSTGTLADYPRVSVRASHLQRLESREC